MDAQSTIIDTAGGGRPPGCLGAAERLTQLSIEHGLGVSALLATLARDLSELEARERELAGADERDRLRLRAEHAGRVTARLVAAAAGLAELGGTMRTGFSRLLTEQLASGNHGLMDVFQEFFAVLPEQDVDQQRLLGLAAGRTEVALKDIEALLTTLADMQATPPAPARKPRPAVRARRSAPRATPTPPPG